MRIPYQVRAHVLKVADKVKSSCWKYTDGMVPLGICSRSWEFGGVSANWPPFGTVGSISFTRAESQVGGRS